MVNFNGDGGFLFNAQEFATAVDYNLPVVTVIMNNGSWGSEKAYQRYAFNERYVGADTLNPRYDKYAELFGGVGYYVERPEDVGNAMIEALAAGRPSIIEIPIDPDELPASRAPCRRAGPAPGLDKILAALQVGELMQDQVFPQEISLEGNAIVITWDDGRTAVPTPIGFCACAAPAPVAWRR